MNTLNKLLVTLVKNEHLYLDEWISYHLALGINKIIIVEDVGSDTHESITSKYENVELWNICQLFNKESFSRHNIQSKVANYFLVRYQQLNWDWMAFLDPDEFIMCVDELDTILNKYKDFSGIEMEWEYFGADNHFNRPEGGSLMNYTEITKGLHKDMLYYRVKSFNNLKKGSVWIDPHSLSEKGQHSQEIWVNHYITRSFEDYCFKIYQRGDVYHRIYRSFQEFFKYNPTFDEQKCKDYIKQNLKQQTELVDTTSDKTKWNDRLYVPNHSTGKSIIIFPHLKTLHIREIAQTLTIPAFITSDCGKIYYDDPSGMYDFKFALDHIDIIAKKYNGESLLETSVKFYGEYGGTETILLKRYDSTKDTKNTLVKFC